RSDELVRRLTRLGARVEHVPLIETVPRPDARDALAVALRRCGPGDWVAVTSPAGARILTARAAAPPPGARVAAVGPATADALRGAGWPVDLVAARSVGEGLVEAFPPAPPGGRVVLARAAIARDAVPRDLASRGWKVDDVAVYDTVDRPLDPDSRARLAAADVVVVTASSIARRLVAEVGTDPSAVVVSIGPATSATLAELGVTVAATADPHTSAGLVDAVVTAARRAGLGP
ncbi:MAG: uroporphyrinogen-III synthase, partial [Actinomyces sp.]